MHLPNTDTHPVSFSAVLVHLRHNQLYLPEYLPKRVFKQVCVYVSVQREVKEESMCESHSLNRASLSACALLGSVWQR